MMNFEEFANKLVEDLEERLDGISVEVQLMDKNNGVKLHGLTFKGKVNISPVIYIDEQYEKYSENGKSIDEILNEIEEVYLNNQKLENIDTTFFTDFEKVKSKIIFSVINYNNNIELLNTIPYVKVLDLAIIFKCLVSYSTNECATVLIHNHHLRFWDIDTDELIKLAMENTPRLLEFKFESMTKVLSKIFDNEIWADDDMLIPMYVLSNVQLIKGAGCIFYEGLLNEIAERFHTDFVILPSSVNEVLLIPVDNNNDLDMFSEMVQEVNATQVMPEEILSDHAYYYSRKTGKISM